MSDITDLVAALGGNSVVPAIYDCRYGVTLSTGKVASVDDARGASGFGPQLVGDGTLPTIDGTTKTISTDAGCALGTAASALFDVSSACTFVFIGGGADNLWPALVQDTGGTRGYAFRDVFGGRFGGEAIGIDAMPYQALGMPNWDTAVHMHLMAVSDYPNTIFTVNNPFHSYELAGLLRRTLTNSPYMAAGNNKVLVGRGEGNTASHTATTFRAALFLRGAITRAQINALRSWATTYHAPTYFNTKNGLIQLGDSLTIGLNASDPPTKNPLARVMAQTSPYNMGANYDSQNLGVAGRYAKDMQTLAPVNLYPELGTFRARDIVVVWAGTNDIAVIGRTSSQVIADLSALITAIKVNGATKVAVCTLIPRGDGVMDATKAGYYTTVNASIRTNAVVSWGADLVIDLAAIPGFDNFSMTAGVGSWDNPGGTGYYNADKVHLTDLGYNVIATAATNGIYPRLVATGVLTAAASATHLSVTTQPSTPVASGSAHGTQPIVEGKDASENTDPSYATTITASLVVEAGAASAFGTLTRSPVAGVAAFSGIGATSAGGAVAHWHFTDGSFSVNSASFTITATPPTPGDEFLGIAGQVIPVMDGQAVQQVEQGGSSQRAQAGNLLSDCPWEKRTWQVTTGLLTRAEAAMLLGAIQFRAHVACTGIISDGPVTCEVSWSNGAYINTSTDDGTGILRSFVLLLRQV